MQAEHSGGTWRYQLKLQLLIEWQLQSGNSIQLALNKGLNSYFPLDVYIAVVYYSLTINQSLLNMLDTLTLVQHKYI
jgi:hypothetical protein